MASNYKRTQQKFMNKDTVTKEALKQKRFPEHYSSDRHNGIKDWVITLIDTVKELRRKELYWMYKLKTYAPYVLTKGMSTKRFENKKYIA